MTSEELQSKVRSWDLGNVDPKDVAKYTAILTQLQHHAEREWSNYLPAKHTDFKSGYLDRLAAWIGNSKTEADQKLLLEYALFINFFSHEDFVGLYRTALNREISRWTASEIKARLEGTTPKQFDAILQEEIHHHTWYCPVTDSMDINEFCKVNHLSGVAQHPCFSSLQMLAEDPVNPNAQIAADWIRYMANPSKKLLNPSPSLRRIVLLEDIVGSSTQSIEAVRWAVDKLAKPVLFIPLILCPNGVEALLKEERRWGGKLVIRPIVELRRGDLLGPERKGQQGWPITKAVERLALRCSAKHMPHMDAFGYKGTGCSIATYSNTPDNTLPIVHHKPRTGGWDPLFPRVHRD